ncbi:MAG TPA: hypothetical protein VLK29_13045 [Luteimonas sp.]|nr:hypothetical protein [Luteimonas sp.]
MHAEQARFDSHPARGMDLGAAAVAGASMRDDPVEAFQAVYRDTAYYSTGREWTDYAPAYRFGHDLFQHRPVARFDDLDGLESGWEAARGASRLAWVEARGAVEHAWLHARAAAPHGTAAAAAGTGQSQGKQAKDTP